MVRIHSQQVWFTSPRPAYGPGNPFLRAVTCWPYTCVAIGDEDVVYIPGIGHTPRFVFSRVYDGIGVTFPHEVHLEQNPRVFPTSDWTLWWAIVRRRDCVAVVARMLRDAGNRVPRTIVTPRALFRCLIDAGGQICKTDPPD